MRKSITIAMICISTICFGQADTLGNFISDQSGVRYELIVEVDSVPKDSLERLLVSYLSSISGFQLNGQISGLLNGKIDGLLMNSQDYGCGIWSSWALILNSLHGNVTIQIKDNRYKVTVKDIWSQQPVYPNAKFKIEDGTRRKDKSFKSSNVFQNSFSCMDLFFESIFTLTEQEKLSDDW